MDQLWTVGRGFLPVLPSCGSQHSLPGESRHAEADS